MLRLVPLPDVRADLALRELADRSTQHLLLLGEADIHLDHYRSSRVASRLSRKLQSSAMRRLLIAALTLMVLAGSEAPARADATAFIGTATTPANRSARGFAVGAGLVIVAFEFEYASIAETPEEAAPAIKTGMGNLLLQLDR